MSASALRRGAFGDVRQEVDGFTRIVVFEPGYNDPTTGPHSYGRHGMQLRFLLVGPLGATTFLMFTPFVPGTIAHGSIENGHTMAADLGHHWATPTYEGESTYECEYIPGGMCYYDGSGLRADRALTVFVEDGIDALWALLRSEYDAIASEVES